MKQKIKKSEAITEDYLDTRLELTTKTLLDEMDKLENRLIQEMDKRGQEMDKRHDMVMTALDGIVKELETTREDRELAVYQTREIREQVEEHEKRLTKIEKLQHTT